METLFSYFLIIEILLKENQITNKLTTIQLTEQKSSKQEKKKDSKEKDRKTRVKTIHKSTLIRLDQQNAFMTSYQIISTANKIIIHSSQPKCQHMKNEIKDKVPIQLFILKNEFVFGIPNSPQQNSKVIALR